MKVKPFLIMILLVLPIAMIAIPSNTYTWLKTTVVYDDFEDQSMSEYTVYVSGSVSTSFTNIWSVSGAYSFRAGDYDTSTSATYRATRNITFDPYKNYSITIYFYDQYKTGYFHSIYIVYGYNEAYDQYLLAGIKQDGGESETQLVLYSGGDGISDKKYLGFSTASETVDASGGYKLVVYNMIYNSTHRLIKTELYHRNGTFIDSVEIILNTAGKDFNIIGFQTNGGAAQQGYAYFDDFKVEELTLAYTLTIKIHYIYYTAWWDYIDDPIVINGTAYNFESQTLTYPANTVLNIDIPTNGTTLGGLVYSIKVYLNGTNTTHSFTLTMDDDYVIDIYTYVYPPEKYTGQWTGVDTSDNKTLIVLVPGFKYSIVNESYIEITNTSIVQSIAVLMSYNKYYLLEYGDPWITHDYELDNTKTYTMVNETFTFTNQLVNGSQMVFGYIHTTTYYQPSTLQYMYKSQFGVVQSSNYQFKFRIWINQTNDPDYPYAFYYQLCNDILGCGGGYVEFTGEKYAYIVHGVIVNDTSATNADLKITVYDDGSSKETGYVESQTVFYKTDIIVVNHTEYEYAKWGHFINMYSPTVDYNTVDSVSKQITIVFNFNAYKVSLEPVIATRPAITVYNVQKGDVLTLDVWSFGLYKLIIQYEASQPTSDLGEDIGGGGLPYNQKYRIENMEIISTLAGIGIPFVAGVILYMFFDWYGFLAVVPTIIYMTRYDVIPKWIAVVLVIIFMFIIYYLRGEKE